MRRSFARRQLMLACLAVLLLAACTNGDDERPTPAALKPQHTVKLGLILPLSGEFRTLGTSVRNSVDLAVRHANRDGRVRGWRIQLAAEDDAGSPDTGAAVATELAADAAVAGTVGTLRSAVAQKVQPVLEAAGMGMVSPANTATALTLGDDPANRARPFRSYFRVCPNDSVQGRFAADFVARRLKPASVALVHDSSGYGERLSEDFKSQFEGQGGKIAGVEAVTRDQEDFGPSVERLKALEPGAIYYGGEVGPASKLSPALKQAGVKVPFVGGDGIFDQRYVETAKDGAEGDRAVYYGPVVERLESAESFLQAYEDAGFKDAPGLFGAYGYDAANVVIDAIATVLEGKTALDDGTRRAVVDAIQATALDGVTGKVAFDDFGDNTNRLFTVYRISDGVWKPERTAAFEAD